MFAFAAFTMACRSIMVGDRLEGFALIDEGDFEGARELARQLAQLIQ